MIDMCRERWETTWVRVLQVSSFGSMPREMYEIGAHSGFQEQASPLNNVLTDIHPPLRSQSTTTNSTRSSTAPTDGAPREPKVRPHISLPKPSAHPFLADEFVKGFQVFDKEGRGKIGAGELRYVLTQLGEKMTDEEVDELLKGFPVV